MSRIPRIRAAIAEAKRIKAEKYWPLGTLLIAEKKPSPRADVYVPFDRKIKRKKAKAKRKK